ncbi:MAG: hypothetical protein AAF331_04270, partial [Pseudomonadota bacterium]
DGIEGLIGSRFNDVLVGNDDDKRIDGFTGVDTFFGNGSLVSYESSPTAVGVRMDNQALNFGEAAGDRYFNIVGVQGSDFNDVLVGGKAGGNGGFSALFGGMGDDLPGAGHAAAVNVLALFRARPCPSGRGD